MILGQFTSGIFLKCQADLNIYEFLNFCSLDPKTLIILLIGSILTIISVVLSYYFLKLNLIKNLKSKKLLRFPGAYNPLCAKLIAEIGFDGVYVSGGVMSNDLGFPDIGLTTLQDVSTRSYFDFKSN